MTDDEVAELKETLKRIEATVEDILDRITKPERRHDPPSVVLPPILKIPV